MNRKNGFSLIELMASMAILLLVAGAAITALVQAQRVTQGVALEANTQQNLRSAMHFMAKDVMQAGEGLPPGGISIPNSSTNSSALNWPGTGTVFNNNYVVLNGIVPGYQVGQRADGVTNSGALVSTGAQQTDVITVLYADNSLQDSSGNYLNSWPVVQTSGSKTCNGTLAASAITLDSTCFGMPGTGPSPLATGNLILFQNQNGNALEYVTSVAGSTINFAASDPAGLNAVSASSYPNGTVRALLPSSGPAPPTTITRVWMITYYLDSTTNPLHPQLIRQVNYPGYPSSGAQANPPTAIADDIEDIGLTYDIIDSTAPSGTYPNGAGDAPQPASWTSPSTGHDSPSQIRAVNIYLAGRSENPYQGGKSPTYFHNNLSSQVSIRSLSFVNGFTTSSLNQTTH